MYKNCGPLALALPLLLASCGTSGKSLHPVVAGGRYGFIDGSGKIVIQPQFEQASGFSEGLAAVQMGGKWGYIDPRGRLAISPQFDLADPFSDNGLAVVGLGGKLGYLRKDEIGRAHV